MPSTLICRIFCFHTEFTVRYFLNNNIKSYSFMSMFSSIERGRITRLHFKGRLTRSALRTTCIHNCVYLVTRIGHLVDTLDIP